MCSASDELTAKFVIRNESLRLFAQRGADAVSVRDIAAAAGVSPALVLHHWGSKQGLTAGIDEYVGVVVDQLLEEVSAETAQEPNGTGARHGC
jgi:AcrR family transcriptional regulator